METEELTEKEIYEKYLKKIRDNLNLIERMAESATGLDERMDVTNKLLIQMVGLLAEGLKLQVLKAEPENPPYVIAKQKLVTTAGTAEQLDVVSIPYDHEVVIKALSGNGAAIIYVGTSKLEAEDHTLSFPLAAGDAIEYKIKNLSQIWIDSSVSGKGITWTVEQGERNGTI